LFRAKRKRPPQRDEVSKQQIIIKQTRLNSPSQAWISGVAEMWNCEAEQNQMVEKVFVWNA
jgi:hypothetical protein